MTRVGVEGPSDMWFWRKYLHRVFPGVLFDVRNMKNRGKLIGASEKLLWSFQDLNYNAEILILDIDKNPCVTDIRSLFEPRVATEFRRPWRERFLQVCVADRKIESWFLSDRDAVSKVLPKANYDVPEDTKVWGKGKLRELCRQHRQTYNEVAFSQQIAPHFSADRAAGHSASFQLAWERIQVAVTRRRGD